MNVSASLYVSCALSSHGINNSPVNVIVMLEVLEAAVAFVRMGMKNGDEREDTTFPDRVQSEDERIHMEVSAVLSSSCEVDESAWTVSSLVDMVSDPSLQRTFRESDGYASRPTVFFSNV